MANNTKQAKGEFIRVLNRTMQHFFSIFRRENITYPQAVVLSALALEGNMPIGQLAEMTGNANSTLSGIVDRLEESGLVERVRADGDRRVVYIKTTKSFDSLFKDVRAELERFFYVGLESVPEENRSQIVSALQALNIGMYSEEEKAE